MPPLSPQRIPVQTGANCGLFAVVSAARFLGCDATTERALVGQLDQLEKADPRTFIGEVLSIDLLLDLIRGIRLNGEAFFRAQSAVFSTPAQLRARLQASAQTGSALLIPFARPESYDVFYRLLGRQSTGDVKAAAVDAARKAKDAERVFLPADAHWALVNRWEATQGTVFLADSFEDVWGAGHGYEADFSLEKLVAANLALDGCFDWGNFLDAQGRVWGMGDLLGRAYAPSAPRLKNPARLEAILRNGMQEALDLRGRLIVLERMQ
ncbi:MAG: hypothetical protein KF753_04730 [Caldilineaceae bacterium]|nr:hypothetical protein [Caldilineaceae bacterium]